MRTPGMVLLAGLLSAAAFGCAAAPPPVAAPDEKPVEKLAEKAPESKVADKPKEEKAPEPEARAESEEDGDCKGASCIIKCEKQGRPSDCFQAGKAYREGNDGVVMNAAKSIKYLEKACALKEREGCYELAGLYAGGDEEGGVPKDEARSILLFTTACDLGRGQACDLLSRSAEAGDGMKKDHAKAISWLAKGCAAEDYQVWTCNSLKKAVEAKDKEAVKAIAAWKKACAAKDAKACTGMDRLGL